MIEPFMDGIIVKTSSNEKTAGGIYKPEATKKREMPCEGVIYKTGPDVSLVREGDTVVFGEYAAKKLNEKCEVGYRLLFINEGDLMYMKLPE
jgi:co-chaperonin GroES (HSP10)